MTNYQYCAVCVICERSEPILGNSDRFSGIMICRECRKRLKNLLYPKEIRFDNTGGLG